MRVSIGGRRGGDYGIIHVWKGSLGSILLETPYRRVQSENDYLQTLLTGTTAMNSHSICTCGWCLYFLAA